MNFPIHRSVSAVVLSLVPLVAGCSDPQRATSPAERQSLSGKTPLYSAASQFGGALLARVTSEDGFKLKRKNGKWEFDLNAKDPTDVATQSLTFQPGGYSGWHSHPGPVLVQVTSGTLKFYDGGDPSCTPEVVTAGHLFVEAGDHAHITRNEGGTVATAIAVVFAPPGAPLRIDETAPGNCAF